MDGEVYLMWFFAILGMGLIVAYQVFEGRFLGWLGKNRVGNYLKDQCLEEYEHLKEIVIETEDGKSIIDHLIVCPYGIFVITTLSYRGWIIGEEALENWTCIMNRARKKFKNPLRTNLECINRLKQALIKFNDVEFYSVIIFTNYPNLKYVNVKSDVIYLSNLRETLMKHRGVVQLRTQDIQGIVSHLGGFSVNKTQVEKKLERLGSLLAFFYLDIPYHDKN